MVTRPRVIFRVPDTSEDENLSDDDEYGIPKPLEEVYIPESEDSDNDADDEDDVEENVMSSTTKVPPSVKKTKRTQFVWTDEGIEYDESRYTFLGCETLPDEIMLLESPIDFFKYLFPSSILNLIENESNVYAAQIAPESSKQVTHEDVRKFIGILIYICQ